MSKTKNIINILQNANKIDHGSFKFFVSVSNDVGIKIMPCKITRDNNFKRQKRAYKFKFAPNCWCCFSVVIDGERWHGYFTEKVKKVETYNTAYKQADKLIIGLLRKVGFDFSWDSNTRNMGVDKNGNLVCVDFDCDKEPGKALQFYLGTNFSNCKKVFRAKLRKTQEKR